MVIAIVSLWVMRFPFAYIFSNHTSFVQEGIYYSFVFSNILGAVISLAVFYRGRWMKNVTNTFEKAEIKAIEAAITEEAN